MSEFEATGSWGVLVCDETGQVIEYDTEGGDIAPDEGYHNIIKLDVDEWKRYWKKDCMESTDILDVGYWYRTPDGSEAYEPPAFDWREDIKATGVSNQCNLLRGAIA